MRRNDFIFLFVLSLSKLTTVAQVVDIDGNSYQTVVIGTQEWMAENLITTRFNNGDPIPNIPGINDFYTHGAPAWAYYNNDINHGNFYGKLYNGWVAVDSRNCCPTGWRVPTVADWTTLIDFMGGAAIAGGKLKNSTFWNGTDDVGFSALPGGARYPFNDGNAAPLSGTIFSGQSYFWTSEYVASPDIYYYRTDHWASNIFEEAENYTLGMSIRCVKNGSLGVKENNDKLRKSFVYPNPFSTSATLALNNTLEGDITIKIYTLTGQLVKEVVRSADNIVTIDREGLSEGFYLYSISTTNDNRTLNGKFVIKN